MLIEIKGVVIKRHDKELKQINQKLSLQETE